MLYVCSQVSDQSARHTRGNIGEYAALLLLFQYIFVINNSYTRCCMHATAALYDMVRLLICGAQTTIC